MLQKYGGYYYINLLTKYRLFEISTLICNYQNILSIHGLKQLDSEMNIKGSPSHEEMSEKNK